MMDYEKECRIGAIAEGTWMITDYFNDHMYLLEGKKEALLIDTGIGSLTLPDRIRRRIRKPLQVALTHGHTDHIGAAGYFDSVYLSREDFGLYKKCTEPKLKKIYCNRKMSKYGQALSKQEKEAYILALMQIPSCEELRPMPAWFELGERRIEVIPTPGHTRGSVCFFDQNTKILFSGDTVCDLGVLLNFDHSASLETFASSIKRLKLYPVSCICCGHHQGRIPADYLDKYDFLCQKILGIPEDKRENQYSFQDISIQLKSAPYDPSR